MARVAERVCPCCGQTFRPKRSRVVCCSKRCKALRQHGSSPELQKWKPKEKGPCGNCGKVRTLSCRGLCQGCYLDPHARTHFDPGKRGRKELPRQRRPCEHCGEDFAVPPDRPGQRFCSRPCVDLARTKERPCLYPPAERAALFLEFQGAAKAIAMSLFKAREVVRRYAQADDVIQIAYQELLWLIDRHDGAGPISALIYGCLKYRIMSGLKVYLKWYKPDFDFAYRSMRGRSKGRTA
jgi:hypothetical protein